MANTIYASLLRLLLHTSSAYMWLTSICQQQRQQQSYHARPFTVTLRQEGTQRSERQMERQTYREQDIQRETEGDGYGQIRLFLRTATTVICRSNDVFHIPLPSRMPLLAQAVRLQSSGIKLKNQHRSRKAKQTHENIFHPSAVLGCSRHASQQQLHNEQSLSNDQLEQILLHVCLRCVVYLRIRSKSISTPRKKLNRRLRVKVLPLIDAPQKYEGEGRTLCS